MLVSTFKILSQKPVTKFTESPYQFSTGKFVRKIKLAKESTLNHSHFNCNENCSESPTQVLFRLSRHAIFLPQEALCVIITFNSCGSSVTFLVDSLTLGDEKPRYENSLSPSGKLPVRNVSR